MLLAHAWPGNVRELENAIQRALVSSQGGEIHPSDLPPPLRARSPSSLGADATSPLSPLNALVTSERAVGAVTSLVAVEKETIAMALVRCAGNHSEAAAQLGIGPATTARCANTTFYPGDCSPPLIAGRGNTSSNTRR